ncbi:ABC transporter permease [Cohnella cellulosilytica]|uniref:ABC transporter permease n=1 Tax=Cohnella cellulosilytica TaxID=986710 RepID=A0ABW2FDB7_9BACL
MSSRTTVRAAGRSSFFLRLGRKCIQYFAVIALALTINFALPRLAPGDPLAFVIGQELYEEMTPDERQAVRKELELDGSVLEQYGRFIASVATLDMGLSTKYGKPVTEVLRERMPWTFLVVVPPLVLTPLIGVALGVYAAWNRGRKRDAALLTAVLTVESMPGFWFGMVLIAVFGVKLGWFPTYGAAPMIRTDDWSYYVSVAEHLAMPVATITIASIGTYFLLMRSTMLDALGQDYMMLAEAKGVGKRGLMFKHAMRNAMLPVYTHVTMSLSMLFSGAVIVETVFSYPGIGSLLYESVMARDFTLMQGVFLMSTVSVILANMLADLTYPLVDPRARYRRRSGVAG